MNEEPTLSPMARISLAYTSFVGIAGFSFILGWFGSPTFSVRDIEDFGMTRLQGEVYTCEHKPRTEYPTPMSLTKAREALGVSENE